MSLHDRARERATRRFRFEGEDGVELNTVDIAAGDDDWDEEAGECPTCGSQTWSCIVYGRYSQRATYSFEGGTNYADYDVMETEGVDDSDQWECTQGHAATNYITDMLTEVI